MKYPFFLDFPEVEHSSAKKDEMMEITARFITNREWGAVAIMILMSIAQFNLLVLNCDGFFG